MQLMFQLNLCMCVSLGAQRSEPPTQEDQMALKHLSFKVCDVNVVALKAFVLSPDLSLRSDVFVLNVAINRFQRELMPTSHAARRRTEANTQVSFRSCWVVEAVNSWADDNKDEQEEAHFELFYGSVRRSVDRTETHSCFWLWTHITVAQIWINKWFVLLLYSICQLLKSISCSAGKGF